MGIISKIKNFFKTPFKTKVMSSFSRYFSFFNKDLATNETIFSAINMLSNAVASAPFSVRKKHEKLRPSEHIIARLFKYGPNPRMTMFNFIRTMEVNVNTKGAGYAIKEYGYAGQVTGVWVLNPEYVTPIIETGTNELYYCIRDGGEAKYVHNSHIIAITYLTTDGYTPISPLDVLRNTIDYDRETKEFSLNQMANGLKANLVVKIQTKLSKENLDEYNAMMENMKKTGVIYVDAGKDFQELKNTNYIDPNVAAIDNITVERVERVYSMIGKLTKGSSSNNTNTDTEDLLFMKDAILPKIRIWEQELSIKLISEPERDLQEVEVKANMNGFARATIEKRGNFYQIMVRNGLMSRNEIRALEDLPPVDGGDEFFLSRDMCPSDLIRDLISSSGPNNII